METRRSPLLVTAALPEVPYERKFRTNNPIQKVLTYFPYFFNTIKEIPILKVVK